MRETFASDLSPPPCTPNLTSPPTPSTALPVTKLAYALGMRAQPSTHCGSGIPDTRSVSKRQKQISSVDHGSPPSECLRHASGFDERQFLGSTMRCLADLEPSYLKDVANTMCSGLQRDSHKNLRLLIQCFVTIGSPLAIDQLRLALPAIRNVRTSTEPTVDFREAMIELERSNADAIAAIVRRRNYLLTIRREHKELSTGTMENQDGERGRTRSLDIMVSRLIEYRDTQEQRMQEMLGDEASVRRKIIKYLAQARNWETLTSVGFSALPFLLIADRDVVDVSPRKWAHECAISESPAKLSQN